MNTDARLDELEARLAHQDQAILEMGEEIYQQQKQIGLLENQCLSLVERIKSLTDGATPQDPANEVPPHY